MAAPSSKTLKVGKKKLLISYKDEIKDFTELLKEGFADKLVENIGGFYHSDAADKIAQGLLEIAS